LRFHNEKKPGQEATGLEDPSALAPVLVSLATTCIGRMPAVVDAITFSHAFWGVRVLPAATDMGIVSVLADAATAGR
jgi:hypothetical protein